MLLLSVIMFVVCVALYYHRLASKTVDEATVFWKLYKMGLRETLVIRSAKRWSK